MASEPWTISIRDAIPDTIGNMFLARPLRSALSLGVLGALGCVSACQHAAARHGPAPRAGGPSGAGPASKAVVGTGVVPMPGEETEVGPIASPQIISVNKDAVTRRVVKVANPLAYPIALRSMKTNCTCIKIDELVEGLKPLGEAEVEVRIEKWPHAGVDRVEIPWESKDGAVRGTIRFWVVRK